MNVERMTEIIGADFYTGVPDSQLKPLCDYLVNKYSTDSTHHIIAANEGNSVAIAAGYYLSTGKIPVVYMQNSGEGNVINPVASLLNENVYAIPVVFVIGWRGEPGVHDEPQHIFQGEVTIRLLEDVGISTYIIGKDTSEADMMSAMMTFKELLARGKSVAFVIKKGALTDAPLVKYTNNYRIRREDIIRHIVAATGTDPIVSTTGKASRELFEIREQATMSHECDFLTVGSMGHSSSIALGIALQKKEKHIWCIDGDGAMLMHMGSLAVIGSISPNNLTHIIINNEAHETVGGMPTAVSNIDVVSLAKSCGYSYAVSVDSLENLDAELEYAKQRNMLTMIEVKCAIGARGDLGRPTVSTLENKQTFMEHLLHG